MAKYLESARRQRLLLLALSRTQDAMRAMSKEIMPGTQVPLFAYILIFDPEYVGNPANTQLYATYPRICTLRVYNILRKVHYN